MDSSNNWLQNIIDNNELYKEVNTSINCYYIYLDQDNYIKNVKKNKILLEYPILKKEQILYMISNHNKHTKNKYKLAKLISFNFNANHDEITDIIDGNISCSKFINKYSIINDIVWDNTLYLFSSLNSIYFIYREKYVPNFSNKTRKNKLSRKDFTRKNY